MRFIPTKVHGILDYVSGALFILSPWIFGFANGGAAQWIPIIVGATILVVSLMTDYELSVTKQVPLRTHLALDILSGALLVASPWIFTFYDWVYWPHLLFGIAEIGAGLFTRKVPDYRTSRVATEAQPVHTPNRGDVVDRSGQKMTNEAQRHMIKDEELAAHARAKNPEQDTDPVGSRQTRDTQSKPRPHDD